MSDTRLGPIAELRKLVARARARGVGEIAHLTLDRLKENLASSETLIVFVRPAEGERRPVEGLKLRRATVEDADRYASDIGTDSADTFARRLSDSTRCYVVVGSGGTFFHATWITTKAAWTRELRAHFRPPPGDAYVFESFTRADARGKGAYPFALREICHELSAEDVARDLIRNRCSRDESSLAVGAVPARPPQLAPVAGMSDSWLRASASSPSGGAL